MMHCSFLPKCLALLGIFGGFVMVSKWQQLETF